jgi:hypothetical protein
VTASVQLTRQREDTWKSSSTPGLGDTNVPETFAFSCVRRAAIIWSCSHGHVRKGARVHRGRRTRLNSSQTWRRGPSASCVL